MLATDFREWDLDLENLQSDATPVWVGKADVELDEPVVAMVAEGVSPNIMLDKVTMGAWSEENIPGSPTQTLVLRQRLLHLEPVAGFKW
jgi:hypothetical protein